MTYVVAFAGGLLGSVHCLGMCGGFPLALARTRSGLRTQLLYNLGRLNSLLFVGVASGALGAAVEVRALSTGPDVRPEENGLDTRFGSATAGHGECMLIVESLMPLVTAFVVVVPLAMALMIIGAPQRRQPERAVVRVETPPARRPRS